MKLHTCLIIALIYSVGGVAQILDNNIKNGVILPSDNQTNNLPFYKLDTTGDNTPSVDLKNPLSDPISFSIETTTDLLDAGEELQKRWNKEALKTANMTDLYLGDFKTSSTFLGFECRDHMAVDGDRVQVFVNGVLVEAIISLTGYFKGINIDLEDGLNQIDIVALNQGTSGYNTAQFRVINDDGSILTSQQWHLATGGKATIIVLKE
jgi:hypothetical protein